MHRTDHAENDGDEDQTVERAQQHDTEIHSEIVHSEQGSRSEIKDDDSQKFCAGDTNQHRATHLSNSGLGSFKTSTINLSEFQDNMGTELH